MEAAYNEHHPRSEGPRKARSLHLYDTGHDEKSEDDEDELVGGIGGGAGRIVVVVVLLVVVVVLLLVVVRLTPTITMVPSSLIPNGPRRVREPGRAVKPCAQRWLSHETNRLPTASTSLTVAPSCRDLSTDPVMPEMVILAKKSKSRI